MRRLTLILVAVAALSACQTGPVVTSASLATQGAKRVPGAQIASTLSDHTAYAEYTMPYRKNRQGSTWAEYYASDSTYYYKSGRLSFVGKWTVEGDNICYFQEDAKGCGPVYDLNGVLYLQSDQPDRYQGKVIAKIVRVEPGDAAHLKDSISPR